MAAPRCTRARWVVGIDEVGRGALAGPVTVAAAMLAVDARGRLVHAPFRSLKDSKKLTAAQREFWAAELTADAGVRFAIARVYPRGIERLNISAAANLAALRAFSRLSKDSPLPPRTRVYLDGGLFLGSKAGQRKAVADKNHQSENGHKRGREIPGGRRGVDHCEGLARSLYGAPREAISGTMALISTRAMARPPTSGRSKRTAGAPRTG